MAARTRCTTTSPKSATTTGAGSKAEWKHSMSLETVVNHGCVKKNVSAASHAGLSGC